MRASSMCGSRRVGITRMRQDLVHTSAEHDVATEAQGHQVSAHTSRVGGRLPVRDK